MRQVTFSATQRKSHIRHSEQFLHYLESTMILLLVRSGKIPGYMWMAALSCAIFLLSSTPATGQIYLKQDSFEHAAKTEPDINKRLRAAQYLFRNIYTRTRPESRLTYVPYLDSLTSLATDKKLVFETRSDIAAAYCNVSNYDTCIALYERLLSDSSSIPSVKAKPFAYSLLAMAYDDGRKDEAKAAEYHDRAIDAAKAINDSTITGAMLCNASGLYSHSDNCERALQLLHDAIIYLKPQGVNILLANTYNNIGLCTDDTDEAIQYIKKAKTHYAKASHYENANYMEFTQGRIYHENGLHKKANTHFERYFSKAPDSTHEYVNAGIKTYYALSLFKAGKLHKADSLFNYLNNKIATDKMLTGQELLFHKESFKVFAEARKDYKSALDIANQLLYHLDTLEENLNISSSHEFYAKYETEKKENQIAQQALQLEKEKRRKNQFLFFGILGLLSALGLGTYFTVRARQKKREAEYTLQLAEIEKASLRELDQMKSRWFENISHDIRTPLTLISAPINDALKTTQSKEVKELLQIASRNSTHLFKLTNEMLELARLENGVVPIKKQSKLLKPEIEKLTSAFQSFADEQNVNITTKLNIEQDAIVAFDYDKYEKVFNNLLKNAIQYSPSNSNVTISASYDDNRLTTGISDEGPGIPSAEIDHIFDKYFRASHEQSSLIQGSGLGLHIVKELIDIQQGDIRAMNNDTKGMRFEFVIPVEQVETQSLIAQENDSTSSEEAGLLPLQGNERILLVEDTQEMSNYLLRTLRPYFQTDLAETALVALQKLGDNSYDLIISDIMMPGMDGFEFKKRVNHLTAHVNTPFIFLSAKALDSDKMEGLKLGVDDYLTKPFLTDELLIRIKNLLSNKQVRQLTAEDTAESLEHDSNSSHTTVQKATNIVLENIDNISMGVDLLADKLNYSKGHVNRLLKEQTGMTAVKFILEVRLQHARELLLSNEIYSVKEVQLRVGIQSQSYFSKKFTERFGYAPSKHVE